MSHARALNVLNREQLQKMKALQCHEKYRVRTRYPMKLAEDAKTKLTHKQVYEKLLDAEWFLAEASTSKTSEQFPQMKMIIKPHPTEENQSVRSGWKLHHVVHRNYFIMLSHHPSTPKFIFHLEKYKDISLQFTYIKIC